MGPIAYLADLTLECGVILVARRKIFGFLGLGSIPIILEIRGFKPLCFTLSK